MKPIARQFDRRAAFTIVELLTVMSIIVILISLLGPSLNMARRFARDVRQKNQFHNISVAMELFNAEQEGYPDSDAMDGATTPQPYCGAMKLCEVMVGQDLLGVHPDSRFISNDTSLYPQDPSPDNLKARRGPYLQLENANAYRMGDLYSDTGPFNTEDFVLCDVYTRVRHRETGKRTGMPILYYKADISGTKHDPNAPNDSDNIYDYHDNHMLVGLGFPDKPPPGGPKHKLFEDLNATPPESQGWRFYVNTKNDKIDIPNGRPLRSDSYILISAGFDGEYGTKDDIFNFQR